MKIHLRSIFIVIIISLFHNYNAIWTRSVNVNFTLGKCVGSRCYSVVDLLLPCWICWFMETFSQSRKHTLLCNSLLNPTLHCVPRAPEGAAVVKWLSSWLAEQEVRGSILGLTTWISEICYLLLPSRYMAEIPVKRRKSFIQPTNQPESPSVCGFVACLPVRLLFKSIIF